MLLDALRSLVLGASLTVAGLVVTRSSLLGFDVGPARGLDAGEVAALVSAWSALPVAQPAARPTVETLDAGDRVGLRSVCERDGWTVEAWTEGPCSRRRVRQLRAALGSRCVRERSERDGRHMVYWTA